LVKLSRRPWPRSWPRHCPERGEGLSPTSEGSARQLNIIDLGVGKARQHVQPAGAEYDLDPVAEPALQGRDQGGATGLVGQHHASQVAGEVALPHELGHRQLLEHRHAAMAQLLSGRRGLRQLGRQDQIA
jgi:hypothetical protein